MMRDDCRDCVKKHLAQAAVLMDEACMGYPDHRWLAVGHLAEASAELVAVDVEVAMEIRDHRLLLMKDAEYCVPVLELIGRVGDDESDREETKSIKCLCGHTLAVHTEKSLATVRGVPVLPCSECPCTQYATGKVD